MIYLLLVSTLFASAFRAEQVEKVSLLELYSSEGCSSCPPAEKAMYDLKSHKNLWKTFVPINFHVDYWNRLGWVDAFSSKKFTDRQHSYANVWKSRRVYTPAFVLDGRESGAILPSVLEMGKKSIDRIVVEKVSEDLLRVRILSKNTNRLQLNFALLANGIESIVKSGENEGRTLKHNFVVMELKEERVKDVHEFKILKPKVPHKSLSYAFWLSSDTTLEVVQAVGGDI
jgi:hypothetical protein